MGVNLPFFAFFCCELRILMSGFLHFNEPWVAREKKHPLDRSKPRISQRNSFAPWISQKWMKHDETMKTWIEHGFNRRLDGGFKYVYFHLFTPKFGEGSLFD